MQLNRDLDNDVFDLGMAVPADTDLQDIHQLLRNDDRDGFMKLFTPEHIDEFFGDDANWDEGVHNQWARARNVLEDIEEAIEFANESPFPDASELLANVYFEGEE